MRKIWFGLCLLLAAAMPASAQLSIQFSTPGLSIGINVPVYPRLALIPGYPVYYAPSLQANFFFYDGLYWVFQGDDWYASSWYDGPWGLVAPNLVPVFILRIPVHYYRAPPPYFRRWRPDAPPRWGEHWGPSWEREHRDWNRWDRRAAPPPAPLPSYQQRYSGPRYPRAEEQQRELRDQHYRYQPRERVAPPPAPPLRPAPGTAMPPGARPGLAPQRPEPQLHQPSPNDRVQGRREPGPAQVAPGRDQRDERGDDRERRNNRDNRDRPGDRPGDRDR
jgi:hypothetical protein